MITKIKSINNKFWDEMSSYHSYQSPFTGVIAVIQMLAVCFLKWGPRRVVGDSGTTFTVNILFWANIIICPLIIIGILLTSYANYRENKEYIKKQAALERARKTMYPKLLESLSTFSKISEFSKDLVDITHEVLNALRDNARNSDRYYMVSVGVANFKYDKATEEELVAIRTEIGLFKESRVYLNRHPKHRKQL